MRKNRYLTKLETVIFVAIVALTLTDVIMVSL